MTDTAYYSLSALTAVLLAVSVAAGLVLVKREADSGRRSAALAIALAAFGLLIVLVAGFALNAIKGATGDLFFQRTQFSIFYIGFGLVLYGSQSFTKAPAVIWLVYAGSVVIGWWFLLLAGDSEIASATRGSHVPQQLTFYIPIYLSLGLCTIQMALMASRKAVQHWQRRVAVAFGAFGAFALLGVLRESTVIATTGVPLIDVLLAFVPFVLASAALLVSATSIGTGLAFATSIGRSRMPR